MQLRDYLNFSVDIKAVPQSRPRGTAKSGFLKFYKLSKDRKYEEYVAESALSVMLEHGIHKPTNSPVDMYVEVWRLPPESWSIKKKNMAYAREILPTPKPDASNYYKLVEDALNKVVYVDDSQVIRQSSAKYYAEEEKVIVDIKVYE